jgi:hypothetical protein
MKKQLVLRPSSASRWIQCPASVKLSLDVPYQESGDAAKLGTAIHTIAETCYLTGVDPDGFVGSKVEGMMIDQDNADFAKAHISAIREIESNQGHVLVEQYLTAYEDEDVRCGGTADVVSWSDRTGTLIVADLKTGRGYVDANSDQMKIYAIGAMRQSKFLYGKIQLKVIQPHHGADRTHEMSLQELRDWHSNTLMPSIKKATQDDVEPTPSESACQWCPAKIKCPAQRQNMSEFADMAEKKIELTHWSDDEIGELLDSAKMVEDYIKALRDYAEKKIKDKGVIKGWQLAPKRAQRKWIDEHAAFSRLVAMGFDSSKLMVTELVSPSIAEKLIGKDNKELLDELTRKESSGLTLAKDASLSLL